MSTYREGICLDCLGFRETLEFASLVEFGKVGSLANEDMIHKTQTFGQNERLSVW
jgi:hypothetical protein